MQKQHQHLHRNSRHNFQVPVLFFLFEICEVGGRRGFSQIWLHVREESFKVLRMVLHFGEMLERIVNIWRFQKQILIIWGGFDNFYGFLFFFFR
jgi:hypothetical protein